jgi:hypothetical protein
MRYKHQYLLDFENPTWINEALAIAYANGYNILFKTALDHETIRFDKLQSMLSKDLEEISDETVSRIIRNASTRSWKEYRCILGAVVLSRKRMPGLPMFHQAKDLGAIISVPKTEDELKIITLQLQQKCYETIRNKNHGQ